MGDRRPHHVRRHFFRFGHQHRATPELSFFRLDAVDEYDPREDFKKSLAIYYDLSKARALQHSTFSDDDGGDDQHFRYFHWAMSSMFFTGWREIESRKHKSLHKE
jgi:hypothetical protein